MTDSTVSELIQVTVPHLTPTIFWRQKKDTIWAKTFINDLKEGEYKFEVTKDGFTFIAKAGEKLYWLNMKTFAMIDPQSFICNITGQYVEVKFEKYFKGFEWPQLYFDGQHKVKFDPDYNIEEEVENTSFQKLVERGELRTKLGLPDHPDYLKNANVKISVSDEDSDVSESDLKTEFIDFENKTTNEYIDLNVFL